VNYSKSADFGIVFWLARATLC